MRVRSFTVAAAIGLLAALVPTTAEAAPAPYRVSMSISATKADVGRTVTLSGSVTGSRAAHKSLLVQRRATGAWRTVKTVRTTAKARFSTKVTVTSAGAQSLRVVAPRSTKRATGTSAARSLTGWRWLDASVTGTADNLRRGTVTIHGARYSGLTVAPRDSGRLLVRFDRRCDAVQYSAGVGGEMNSWAQLDLMQGQGAELAPALARIEPWVSGGNTPLSGVWPLRAESDHLEFGLFSSSKDQRAVLIAPRLHCSVNALPKTTAPRAA